MLLVVTRFYKGPFDPFQVADPVQSKLEFNDQEMLSWHVRCAVSRIGATCRIVEFVHPCQCAEVVCFNAARLQRF